MIITHPRCSVPPGFVTPRRPIRVILPAWQGTNRRDRTTATMTAAEDGGACFARWPRPTSRGRAPRLRATPLTAPDGPGRVRIRTRFPASSREDDTHGRGRGGRESLGTQPAVVVTGHRRPDDGVSGRPGVRAARHALPDLRLHLRARSGLGRRPGRRPLRAGAG